MHKIWLAAVLFGSLAAIGQGKPRELATWEFRFDGNPRPRNAREI